MRRISTRLILSFLVFLLFSSKCLCSIYTTLISVVRYLHISSFFLSLLARNRPRIIISRKNNLGILKVAICFFFKISLRLKMSYRNFYQAVLPKLHFLWTTNSRIMIKIANVLCSSLTKTVPLTPAYNYEFNL